MQSRDHRGRYTRGPQIPPWGWAACIAFAVILVVAVNV
jgi:hypothetical protein